MFELLEALEGEGSGVAIFLLDPCRVLPALVFWGEGRLLQLLAQTMTPVPPLGPTTFEINPGLASRVVSWVGGRDGELGKEGLAERRRRLGQVGEGHEGLGTKRYGSVQDCGHNFFEGVV